MKVEGYFTDLINPRAAEFIGKHAKEPFFLYVPHLAVHCPYQPPGRPKPSVTKANMYDGDRADYAAMVEKVDDGVGMILAELEKHGILDNTLVVLSSDNGGERYSDNTPLFHHKSTLWEGGIRVPCLMRWPAKLPQGKVTGQVGITMDLSATFAAIAGAKPADDRPFDGINLIPILTGEQPAKRPHALLAHRSREPPAEGRPPREMEIHPGRHVEMLFDLERRRGRAPRCLFPAPGHLRHAEARTRRMGSRDGAGEDRHPREVNSESSSLHSAASQIAVAAVLFLCFPMIAGDVAAPVTLPGLHNAFRVTERIFSGSQPDGDAAFAALAQLGVKMIVSVDGAKPDLARAGNMECATCICRSATTVCLLRESRNWPARPRSGRVDYVHCHHGKHRGPAAVAVMCEAWPDGPANARRRGCGRPERRMITPASIARCGNFSP